MPPMRKALSRLPGFSSVVKTPLTGGRSLFFRFFVGRRVFYNIFWRSEGRVVECAVFRVSRAFVVLFYFIALVSAERTLQLA